jgi:hypothetical protein
MARDMKIVSALAVFARSGAMGSLLALLPLLPMSGSARLASASSFSQAEPPHLELDLVGPEYSALLDERASSGPDFLLPETATQGPLQEIIELGTRNLQWLALVNQSRPDSDQLPLVTPETMIAYPIDTPLLSSPELIAQRRTEILGNLPESMREVLVGSGALTEKPPVSDEEFLAGVRKVDRLYQSASRWLLQEPFLASYKGRVKMDIRGYYFLGKEEGLQQKLEGWEQLSSQDRGRLKPWLIGQCLNSNATTLSSCERAFTKGLATSGGAWKFHLAYVKAAKKQWDSFFVLSNARSDILWKSDAPAEMTVPFLLPERAEVRTWLQENIEDEWRLPDWNLRLAFTEKGASHARIEFEPGATAHVNGLGGNVITMNSSRDLHDWQEKWTIRHEFGHVLGLPDCYVEFYDEAAEVMVSYQIDTANLMCSRRGHLKQIHYDELKKNYLAR